MEVDRADEHFFELNASSHGPGLELGAGPRRLQGRYVGEARHANDVGSIQATRPVPLHAPVFYFEVTVLDAGELGKIAVGFSDRSFKLSRAPGCVCGRAAASKTACVRCFGGGAAERRAATHTHK